MPDGGEILLQTTPEEADAAPLLELLALDQGPGMGNLDHCLQRWLQHGHRVREKAGRDSALSKQSDFYTASGQRYGDSGALVGTSRMAGNLASRRLRLGGVNVPKPGEEVCGDSWGSSSTAMDVDDSGRRRPGSRLRSQAGSLEAVRQLHENPDLPPKALLQRVHQALRSTRGAAVAVARIDRAARQTEFSPASAISRRGSTPAREPRRIWSR